MRIKYVGPLRPGVEIAGLGIDAPYDTPVVVPSAAGKRLLEQDVWAPADTKTPEGSDD